MRSHPEAPFIAELPHVTSTLMGAASAAFALASLAILTAYATLDPGKLDGHLQTSAVMFAIALPMFFAAGVFAVWLRIGTVAYLLLGLGSAVWGFGLFQLLRHVSTASAVAFLCSFSVCLLAIVAGLSRHQRASILEAQRRAAQQLQSEVK